jgi:hypothetical protein
MTIIIVEDDPDILAMYKDQWAELLAEATPHVEVEFCDNALHAVMELSDDTFILATDGSIPQRKGLKPEEGFSYSLLTVALEAGVEHRIIASSNWVLGDTYVARGVATEACDKTRLISRIAEILQEKMQ